MNYLLDTNICVAFLRGHKGIAERVKRVGVDNCFISEVTRAESLYGAECSARREENIAIVERLCDRLTVLPITEVVAEFAMQKARLRRQGLMIEDADIFIGITAIVYGMALVTGNIKHMFRLVGVAIENWIG